MPTRSQSALDVVEDVGREQHGRARRQAPRSGPAGRGGPPGRAADRLVQDSSTGGRWRIGSADPSSWRMPRRSRRCAAGGIGQPRSSVARSACAIRPAGRAAYRPGRAAHGASSSRRSAGPGPGSRSGPPIRRAIAHRQARHPVPRRHRLGPTRPGCATWWSCRHRSAPGSRTRCRQARLGRGYRAPPPRRTRRTRPRHSIAGARAWPIGFRTRGHDEVQERPNEADEDDDHRPDHLVVAADAPIGASQVDQRQDEEHHLQHDERQQEGEEPRVFTIPRMGSMARSVYSSSTALDPGRAHPSGADSKLTPRYCADETKEAHPWPAVPPSTLRRHAPSCASATARTPITGWTPRAPPTWRRLPYTVKVLLENALRHAAIGDGLVSAEDVRALAAWDPSAPGEYELPFMPGRVILQDFTGVPCVVDLAAMRDAVAEMGGDPIAHQSAGAGRPGDRPLGAGRPVRQRGRVPDQRRA